MFCFRGNIIDHQECGRLPELRHLSEFCAVAFIGRPTWRIPSLLVRLECEVVPGVRLPPLPWCPYAVRAYSITAVVNALMKAGVDLCENGSLIAKAEGADL